MKSVGKRGAVNQLAIALFTQEPSPNLNKILQPNVGFFFFFFLSFFLFCFVLLFCFFWLVRWLQFVVLGRTVVFVCFLRGVVVVVVLGGGGLFLKKLSAVIHLLV